MEMLEFRNRNLNRDLVLDSISLSRRRTVANWTMARKLAPSLPISSGDSSVMLDPIKKPFDHSTTACIFVVNPPRLRPMQRNA
jgi:hypothetical protein